MVPDVRQGDEHGIGEKRRHTGGDPLSAT